MSYTIKILPNKPILLQTWHEDFDIETELKSNTRELLEILDSVDKPVYFVTDARNANLSFGDVMLTANITVKSGKASVFKHPNVYKTLLITNDNMLKMSAHGLSSDLFGNIEVEVFDNLEEALNYTRSE